MMLSDKAAVATVAVKNLESARKFYEQTLGLTKLVQYAGVFAFPLYTTTSYRALGAGGYAIIHRFEDVYA